MKKYEQGTAERHFEEREAGGHQGGEWCDLRPRVGQGASGARPQPEAHPQLREAHQGDCRCRVRGDPGVLRARSWRGASG